MSFEQIYPADRHQWWCLVSDLVLGLRIFNLYQPDGFSVRLQFGEGKSVGSQVPTFTTGLKSIKVSFNQTVMGYSSWVIILVQLLTG